MDFILPPSDAPIPHSHSDYGSYACIIIWLVTYIHLTQIAAFLVSPLGTGHLKHKNALDRRHIPCQPDDPSTTLAALAPQPINRHVFSLLDHTAVPSSWSAPLAAAVSELSSTLGEVDRAILRPFAAFAARATEQSLVAEGRAQRTRQIRVAAGTHDQHPVAITLIRWRQSEKQFPAISKLLAVLVSAAVGDEGKSPTGRNRIGALASIIRGALNDGDSPLRVLLAGTNSIPDLIRVVDAHLASPDQGLHRTFEGVWKSWLRDTLTRWMLAHPGRLRKAMAPMALVPSLDSPFLPVLSTSGADGDDDHEVENILIEPDESASPLVQFCRAKATTLVRASQIDLYQPPDTLVPEAMLFDLCRAAATSFDQQLPLLGKDAAEEFLAIPFALASALREIDLSDVTWGSADDENGLILAISEPTLHRSLLRPPHAARPPEELSHWLEPSPDRVAWPIPPSLHDRLTKLAGPSGPLRGNPVFPARSTSPVAPYRLTNTIKKLLPAAHFGSAIPRSAVAAHIAQSLGPEVAQVLLADTFSMSAGPAYYSALPAELIWNRISALQARWFGEANAPYSLGPVYHGSRVILTDEAATKWPEKLRLERRSAAHRSDASIQGWIAQRNQLAASLCALTGHRPVNELAC